jgi:hypothetical protein
MITAYSGAILLPHKAPVQCLVHCVTEWVSVLPSHTGASVVLPVATILPLPSFSAYNTDGHDQGRKTAK